MVLVDPSIPDQAARFERVAPAMSRWTGASTAPLVAFLDRCAAALRAGSLKAGSPDPDGCLRPPPQPPNYPPELRLALEKRPAELPPETVAAAFEALAFSASPQVLEQDAKIAIKPDRNYGSMPLVVLTAGEFPLQPDDPPAVKAEVPLMQAEWKRGHDELAALSTRGVNRVVAGASHGIQQIKPQAVIDAIDEVVDAARATGLTRVAR
jgi:hypothetical protein